MRFDEDTLTDTYGKLIAEPLEKGFGTTLGNSLRRVLLSSIEGAAVTALKVRGALHEFTSLPGVAEDVVDVLLNIKSLEFSLEGAGRRTALISVTGPREVTGADIKVDGSVKVLNPGQVIATLDKGAEFEAELFLAKGKGYVPAELNKDPDYAVDVIPLDAAFSPIKKVVFSVENARVGRSTDFDKLILEIWTDGSVTPQGAVTQAASILAEHVRFFILEEDEEYEDEEYAASAAPQDATINENLLKTVEELELSVRAHNCLKNADIHSLSDLVQRTEHDMLRTKNFGRKSLNEIKEILASMGLGFGMRVDMEALKALEVKKNAS
jgi:DNA-directed RNA polymerase subunit alpha